ncbi:MAG TPA: hypothetical protein PK863_05580 [Candidatus Dojkabacteria bacterium]|nr:hypothetical protein [Candidatus Dojkabacteria bacterium]HRP51833.1 hypothetical protein [Candidatus Dojkabacteria bacterium]
MRILKIKKSNLLTNLIIIGLFLAVFKVAVYAETVITIVTAGNASPVITSGPETSTPSDGNNPINVGADLTFQTTATDASAEDYYLIICKTDAVVPGVGGAPPTCSGGSWCVSPVTDSGVQASCTYTTQDSDAESNEWYAFVCDNNATYASCSSPGATGSGSTGSPFKVNHDPTFTAITDDGGGGADTGSNPGGTITFTGTSNDDDVDTLQDTVKLVVCADTTGATASGCSGVELCNSAYVSSNPTCQINIPNVAPDGNYNYYAYVFDSHGFASLSNYETGTYTINNVAPTVVSLFLNNSLNISLAEGITTSVPVNANISDLNSCQDVTTVETNIYRSGIGYPACDTDAEDNDNYCYAQVTCTLTGGTCTGSTDEFADYDCNVDMQYHADSTFTDSLFPLENWLGTVKVIDDNSQSHDLEVPAGVEVLTTNALDVTSVINYGSLNIGDKNDPLDKITVVTATGNVGLDQELAGTDMTDGGSGVIGVNYQKHSLNSGTAYSSGTTLTTVLTEYELNVPKTTSAVAPETKNTWWGLEIPLGIPPGVYTGTNTVTAVKGELAEW